LAKPAGAVGVIDALGAIVPGVPPEIPVGAGGAIVQEVPSEIPVGAVGAIDALDA